MEGLNIKQIKHGTDEYKKELELRNRLMRIPLGLDIYDEDLMREKDDFHLGAFDGGELAGVLVLTKLDGGAVQMRQVAVDEEFQGRGIGKSLVKEAERLAIDEGFSRIVMHARRTAVDFYLKLGYEKTSKEFMEVGIPHVEMKKDLC